eukprot:EG_transcript_5770
MIALPISTGALADLPPLASPNSRRPGRALSEILGPVTVTVPVRLPPPGDMLHMAGSGLHAAGGVPRRPSPLNQSGGGLGGTAGPKDVLSRSPGTLTTSRTRHALASTYTPSASMERVAPPAVAPALVADSRRSSPPTRLMNALELASAIEASAARPAGRAGILPIPRSGGSGGSGGGGSDTPAEDAPRSDRGPFVLPMSPTRGTLAGGALPGRAASFSMPVTVSDSRIIRPVCTGGLPGGAGSNTLVRLPETIGAPVCIATASDDVWALVNEAANVRHPWRSIVNSSAQTTSGLSNLGNTCFMNSCLQCLMNIKPLASFFISGEFKAQRNLQRGLKGQLADAFGELLRKMWDGGSFIAPSTFKQMIGTWSSTFQGSRQHDAQEFLRFLLDGLHEDLNRIPGKPLYQEMLDIAGELEQDTARRWWDMHKGRNDSFMMDLFCGQLKSCVRCMTCGHASKAFDPFMDLSLNLPQTNSGAAASGTLTLVDCLARFSREEMLSGSESFYCSRCKAHQESAKQISVWRLPPVLVLHFKRFAYNATVRRKLGQDIQFSLKEPLDMAPYCSGKPTLNNGATCEGRYMLNGVINHMGTMEGGHYTAHCRSAANNQWYEFDDSRVTKVAETAVGGPAAYILFYRLVQ